MKKVTVETIQTAVKAIAEVADDPENAHGREDSLWRAVLEAIAAGAPNAVELAKAALESEKIEFPHWYA
jgi:hypothetical protein